MANRRGFLKKLSLISGAALSAPALSVFANDDPIKFDGLDLGDPPANDDDLWSWVRMQFSPSPSYIYMNNAGLSPSPQVVRDAWYKLMEVANGAPSHVLWRIIEAGRDNVKKRLADLLNCSHEELTIVRNATEALSIIVNQIKLKKGDEVVLCKYDYPRMLTVWEQKKIDSQIKLQYVDLDFPEDDEQKIVDKYVSLFNDKTKVVYLTEVINWTGQVIPVAKIAKEAKKKGITVILDPTQSIGQRKLDLGEIDCDYAGMSLHKWMHGPTGTGLLYVKKNLIPSITSYFSPSPKYNKTMLKFDDYGTRNSTSEVAIAHAIDFLEYTTLEGKISRLNYLKNYWLDQIRDLPGFYNYTPDSTKLSTAIVTFGFKDVDSAIISNKLMNEESIIVANCTIHNISGVRVSPSIYTNEYELDLLVEKIRKIIKK